MSIRYHVTSHGDAIRKEGFKRTNLGGVGIGGTTTPGNLYTFSSLSSAERLKTELDNLEKIRTSKDPLSFVKHPKWIERTRELIQQKLGKATDRQVALSIASSYVPFTSFDFDGPERKFEILKVDVSNTEPLTQKDDEESWRPEEVKLVEESTILESQDEEYPLAGSIVDGREVLPNIDNQSSISATLGNYEVLKGIRELSLPEWNADPYKTFYSSNDIERSKDLAEKIKQSNSISPLIVVIGSDGPYILEGIHRLVALHILGAKSFPALVVKDLDDLEEDTKILYSKKNKDGDLEVKIAKVRDGYSVSLWDLDAGDAVPFVKIFPSIEQAQKYAQTIIPDNDLDESLKEDDSNSKEFKYGMPLRPAGIGSAPEGFIKYDENEGYDETGERDRSTRHGVVTYPNELSDEQIEKWEMVPIHNEAYLQRWIEKAWDKLKKYAHKYLEMGGEKALSEQIRMKAERFGPIHPKEYERAEKEIIAKAKGGQIEEVKGKTSDLDIFLQTLDSDSKNSEFFYEPSIIKNKKLYRVSSYNPEQWIGWSPEDLALTVHGEGTRGGELSFAYDSLEQAKNNSHYGDTIWEFTVPRAIKVYHKGDDEFQIVFSIKDISEVKQIQKDKEDKHEELAKELALKTGVTGKYMSEKEFKRLANAHLTAHPSDSTFSFPRLLKAFKKQFSDMEEDNQGIPKHLYHVTNKKNLPSIMKKGLIPSVGKVTLSAHGTVEDPPTPLVYLSREPARGLLNKDSVILKTPIGEGIFYFDGQTQWELNSHGGMREVSYDTDLPIGVEEGDFYSFDRIHPGDLEVVKQNISIESVQIMDKRNISKDIKIPSEHDPESDGSGFSYRLSGSDNIYYAIDGDRIVGHIGLKDDGYIDGVYVDDAHRRKGIAEALHIHAVNDLGEIWCDKDTMESEEIKLFQKLKQKYPKQVSFEDGKWKFVKESKIKHESSEDSEPFEIKDFSGVLYHGSSTPIVKFGINGAGRFGKGLYLTPDKEWAEFYAQGSKQGSAKKNASQGHVYEFNVNGKALFIKDLEEFIKQMASDYEPASDALGDTGGDLLSGFITKHVADYVREYFDVSMIWFPKGDSAIDPIEQVLVLDAGTAKPKKKMEESSHSKKDIIGSFINDFYDEKWGEEPEDFGFVQENISLNGLKFSAKNADKNIGGASCTLASKNSLMSHPRYQEGRCSNQSSETKSESLNSLDKSILSESLQGYKIVLMNPWKTEKNVEKQCQKLTVPERDKNLFLDFLRNPLADDVVQLDKDPFKYRFKPKNSKYRLAFIGYQFLDTKTILMDEEDFFVFHRDSSDYKSVNKELDKMKDMSHSEAKEATNNSFLKTFIKENFDPDWGSKLEDFGFDEATKKKIKWYHGTPVKFDKFDLSKATTHGFGKGIYFSDNKDDAKIYAGKTGRVIELDDSNLKLLDIEKDRDAVEKIASNLKMKLGEKDSAGAMYDLWAAYDNTFNVSNTYFPQDITDEIMKMGYDGVFFKSGSSDNKWLVVYNPDKIEEKKVRQ